MKHLKTFEIFSINEGFLEDSWAERTKEVQEYGLEAGDFVNLSGEYGDVWHEVESVYDEACSVYMSKSSKGTEVKTEYTFFHDIDKVRRSLPSNKLSVAILKTGVYSDRRGNLSEIPVQYKRDTGIDSIVNED